MDFKNKKVVLVIIHNHQFNKNISILEEIYSRKFSNIFHLVPFYTGNMKNVIPVYENSYYFQGYIAQGFKHFFRNDFLNYIFIADDLILNPIINENNYFDHFCLKTSSCYLTGFLNLHEIEIFWNSVNEAYSYRLNASGVEVINQIPSYNEALELFNKFGLTIGSLTYDQLYPSKKNIFSLSPKDKYFKNLIEYVKWKIDRFLHRKTRYELSYPLIGSYSDICIVSSNNIKKFCHYCGVFAATNLFVELALPTAMILSADNIVTEKNLTLRGKALWPDGFNRLNGNIEPAIGDFEELYQFNYSLKTLLSNFPLNYIYLHPIKLSEWNTIL